MLLNVLENLAFHHGSLAQSSICLSHRLCLNDPWTVSEPASLLMLTAWIAFCCLFFVDYSNTVGLHALLEAKFSVSLAMFIIFLM